MRDRCVNPARFCLRSPVSTEKCRAWPKSKDESGAEKGWKWAFFKYWRREASEKPRARPLFGAKSLSVEQFSCTNFDLTPLFLSLTPTKKDKSPTNGHVNPSLSKIDKPLALQKNEGVIENVGGAIRLISTTYPKNSPFSTPYISDCPPPPERRACG